MADLVFEAGKEPIMFFKDGDIHLQSWDGSEEFVTACSFKGELSTAELHYLCGIVLNQRRLDERLSLHDLARPTDVSEIPIDQIPSEPVIKMMKRKHAEQFVAEGLIRLGSIDYYSNHENPEVRDPTEGQCVVVTYTGQSTDLRFVKAGLNDWILCCYVGTPDPAVVQKFTYDATVHILDPAALAERIGNALKCKTSHFSKCAYVRDRVLYGNVIESQRHAKPSEGILGEMLGPARAFLKHNAYRHQSEFRFIWRCDGRLSGYQDIKLGNLEDICRIIDC